MEPVPIYQQPAWYELISSPIYTSTQFDHRDFPSTFTFYHIPNLLTLMDDFQHLLTTWDDRGVNVTERQGELWPADKLI